jgi:hypothetical protein
MVNDPSVELAEIAVFELLALIRGAFVLAAGGGPAAEIPFP